MRQSLSGLLAGTARNDRFKMHVLKELGRMKLSAGDVTLLKRLFDREASSSVRREIISAIGRQRREENLDVLIEFSREPDPKLVMQSLRGLFCFADHPRARRRIMSLKRHRNEMVREFVLLNLAGRQARRGATDSAAKHAQASRIMHGDVIRSLQGINDGVVHLTFTSPPYYNARDYSIYGSYEEYLGFLERAFAQVYRVTAEGRFFILNTSPVIIPRASRQTSSKRYAIPFDMHPRLERIGFEFIDDILWRKPDPSAKNRNGGFFQHRRPLGYKPNIVVEYVMVYRKKTDRLLDWNMRQYGGDVVEQSLVWGQYDKTNVWEIGAASNRTHPAVFPKKLAETVIKLYSYVGDLVLDPFAGIGTVGMACIENKRDYLLIERDDRYVKQMRKNLDNKAAAQLRKAK